MTFKQKLKLINFIFVILSAICLLIPTMKDTISNYNMFQLVVHNGFRFFVLLLVVSIILSFITSFVQISFDDNNIIPIINMLLAFISIILSALLKIISSPSSDLVWDEYAKLYIGSYILIPSISIVFITSLVITIRSLVLKKDDGEEMDEPNEVEIVSNSSETQIDDNEYLLSEFNSK